MTQTCLEPQSLACLKRLFAPENRLRSGRAGQNVSHLRQGIVLAVLLVIPSGGHVWSQDSRLTAVEQLRARLAAENSYTHHRASRLAQQLNRFKAQLNSGQTSEALLIAQQLLEVPFDTYVTLDGGRRPTSLKRQLASVFDQLPDQVRAEYERQTEPDALNRLRSANGKGELHQLIKVVREFSYTPSGKTALIELAERFLEQGQIELAATCYLRLVVDARHRRRMAPSDLLKAAVVLSAAGYENESTGVQRLLRTAEFELGGVRQPAPIWASRIASAVDDLQTSSHHSLSPSAAAADSAHTTPFLLPLWSRSTLDGTSAEVQNLVAAWKVEQTELQKSLATAQLPIAVGNTVITRTPQAIQAIRSDTGEVDWTYECSDSLQTALDAVVREMGSNQLAEQRGRPYADLQHVSVRNSVVGMTSTDGKRVYAVDYVDLRTHRVGTRRWLDESFQLTSRIVALDPARRDPDGRLRPVWVMGGPPGTPAWFEFADQNRDSRVDQAEWSRLEPQHHRLDANQDGRLTLEESRTGADLDTALHGHYFLGPPLVSGPLLFVMSEIDRQLNVSAIEAATGQMVWTQPIAFTRFQAARDAKRSPLACVPVLSRGLLICPTRSNTLVAVHAITGELAWTQYYNDDLKYWTDGDRRIVTHISYGNPGFVDLPVVAGDTVVLLPQFSQSIYGFDLATGAVRWTVNRHNTHQTDHDVNGDEYIGGTWEDTILIVGNRFCRAIERSTGDERWSRFFGQPSGRGLQSGRHYYLPLDEGKIVCLDIPTGHQIGHAIGFRQVRPLDASTPRLPDDWRPGNLVACGDQIISVSIDSVESFPQARSMLAAVQDSTSNAAARSVHTALLTAQIQLTLGDLEDAHHNLRELYEEISAGADRELLAGEYRSVLYRRFDARSGDPDELLRELQQFNRDPIAIVQYNVRVGRRALELQQAERLLESIDQLLEVNPSVSTIVDDPTHHQSVASHCASLLKKAASDWNRPARDELGRLSTAHWNALASQADPNRLMRWASILGSTPVTLEAQAQLIQRYRQHGRWQDVELLLLRQIASRDEAVQAQAAAGLVRLWDRLGRHDEAVEMLEKLRLRWAQTLVADNQTGAQFAANYSGSEDFASIRLTRVPTLTDPANVVVRPLTPEEIDPLLFRSFSGFRSNSLRLPHHHSLLLLEKGTDQNPELAVLDRRGGIELFRIPLPREFISPLINELGYVGHLMTGISREPQGVRLLAYSWLHPNANGPYWERWLEGERPFVRAGPIGPTFASFQYKDRLLVVNPQTGQTLWERSDLAPKAGFVQDTYAGIFGDDRVLVVLDGDRKSYTCYETATGDRLHKGTLEFQKRIRLGRRLLCESRDERGKRFRMWDPAENEYEFSVAAFEPIQGRTFMSRVRNNPEEIAMVIDDGQLVIWNHELGQLRNRLDLTDLDWSQVIDVSVFERLDRYYVAVSLQRSDPHLRRRDPGEPRRDAVASRLLAFSEINGELRSFRKSDEAQLWRRELEGLSILQTPDPAMPFLVAVSELRSNRRPVGLEIQALDPDSGAATGPPARISEQTLIHADYDARRQRLRLYGISEGIEIKAIGFGRDALTQ